ncbi:putative nuclease associated modular domain 3 [Helianthus annuus]|nr:putative nuclease associated modular domain 3 [Helianthus annuus]
MPLLDIITPQSPFTNNNNSHLYSIGFHTIHHASTARWRRRYCHTFTAGIQVSRGRMMIRAVATLEPLSTGNKETDNAQQVPAIEPKSSIEDDKELLRRKRISKANKGKEAWNKGVKHSPETRQKIRERTRLAMRRPQVKMKLLKGIHKQTLETRLKIAAAVRLTWDRKRYNRRMIARCHSEWLNLLAEASRKGFCGEEELQWDSYDVINQQLGKEFKEGIESRKKTRGSGPGVRAPKTLEQRKKISEAIAAKWADPAYRDRVYSGIAKQRGKDPEARDPDWGTKKKSPKKVKPVKDRLYDPKARSQRAKVKTSSGPIKVPPQARFKDPHARYKLEMIKSIRAQRAASDPKISEAILRANILIGEAQRAAEALEAAAATSPTAEASLIETRKLIAEAKSYIKSIEMGNSGSAGASFDKEEIVEGVREIEQRGVNGTGSLDIAKFGEEEGLQANVNGVEHVNLSSTATSSSWSDSTLKTKEVKEDGEKQEKGGKRRKWVCGRLVEVDEDGDEDEDEDGDEDEDEVD